MTPPLGTDRDTLEQALSVFDRRLRNPGSPIRQA